MKTKPISMGVLLAGVVLGAALSAFLNAGPRPVQGQVVGIKGAGEAGRVDDPLVWKTLRGEVKNMNLQRVVVKIPKSYGRLVEVSGNEPQVLWFADEQGSLRNVLLSSTLMVQVQQEAQP